MSKLLKLALVLSVAALAALTVSPALAGNSCPGALRIAHQSPCVQSQMADSSVFQKSCTVTDHGNGHATVCYQFEPKCLRGPEPCRMLTRLVVVEVTCETEMALCNQALIAE